MNKLALLGSAALFLAACSSTPEHDPKIWEPRGPESKYGVVQVGAKQNAELVFCQAQDCPPRTTKYVPPPPPRATAPAQTQFQVHFRWGWGHLDSAGKAEVQSVIASGALQKATSIVVAGRTDPTGSLQYNKRLALQRAQTVKAALVQAGVPAAKITAEAQDPCCNGDLHASKQAMQQLRRTDIDITIK